MRIYGLFVETGPQRKSTNVYVTDLLGCVLFRRTADQAIAGAPEEIRAYLRWLHGHGEPVDPDAPFGTRVQHESRAGGFIGSARLDEDLAPVTAAEVATYARWLEWGRADLLALVEGLDRRRLDHQPASGRTLRGILEHVLGADKGYVYSVFRTTKSVGDPTNAALAGKLDLRVALAEARAAAVERIRASTPAERKSVRQGGASTYTLRRCLRAMLGHEWEHRREIEARLAG